MFISQAHAQDAEAPVPAAPEAVATTETAVLPADAKPSVNTTESLMFNIGLIILMFVFFYVLMLRPQQKRMKEQQSMLSALAKGDRVITNGGIIGTISGLPNDQEIEVEISPGVKVTLLRYSVFKKYDTTENEPKKAA